jgi:hypothetical protein
MSDNLPGFGRMAMEFDDMLEAVGAAGAVPSVITALSHFGVPLLKLGADFTFDRDSNTAEFATPYFNLSWHTDRPIFDKTPNAFTFSDLSEELEPMIGSTLHRLQLKDIIHVDFTALFAALAQASSSAKIIKQQLKK